MIKKAILFLCVVLSFKNYSQKCKIKNDPFTNEKVTSYDFRNKKVYFELKNQEILFEVVFNYWGERSHEFDKGTQVLFKLENGDKMELQTIRNSSPKIEKVILSNNFFPNFGTGTMVTSENFTAYSFAFFLTKAELNKLSSSRIQIIRIPDTDEGKHVDLEAKKRTKRKIKAIKKGATCLFDKL